MWIDYVIGIVAIVIVGAVILKFMFNIKESKNSKTGCNGNCSRCKFRAKNDSNKN